MASSLLLARHCHLTISVAFTNVTRFIQRVVNFRDSTYDIGYASLLARCGSVSLFMISGSLVFNAAIILSPEAGRIG